MSESKDPAIKLFGKTIPVLEISPVPVDGNLDLGLPSPASSVPENDVTDGDGEGKEAEKGTLGGKGTEPKQENGGPPMMSEECTNPDAISGISENPKTASVDKESATLTSSKTEEEQNDNSVPQEKTLKKPDKILPCPRCNSMDTKFCYYNNYNVNQPRYFCKNCQRYWTAGGTMRNVPVGAGRRKNKNATSHYRHITVSEALQNARTDVPNGVHHPSLKANGTVLTFGSDTPLCESMASVLNLAEKTLQNSTENGFQKPEVVNIPVSHGDGDNGINYLNGSSVTALNSKDEAGKAGSQDPVTQNREGFPPQMPCFPGAPWPYPWNSAHWSSPVLPPAAFCPPAYPVPFYPAASYWGYTVPGTWNIPWLPQPSSPNHTALSSGPNSPTLGKHSRDENMAKTCNSGEEGPLKENSTERSLWIPKTLRIDDPGEAAKSSIWATLGIKNDKADSISGGGLFKAFQSKVDEKNHTAKTSPVLQANPAALSRSLNFQESS